MYICRESLMTTYICLLFRLKKNYFMQREIFARFSRFQKLHKNKSWQNYKA